MFASGALLFNAVLHETNDLKLTEKGTFLGSGLPFPAQPTFVCACAFREDTYLHRLMSESIQEARDQRGRLRPTLLVTGLVRDLDK